MSRINRRKDSMSEMGPTADSASTAHLFAAGETNGPGADAGVASSMSLGARLDPANADAAWMAPGTAAPVNGSAPDAVPGAVVDDLRDRLVELQSTVERLVNQPAPQTDVTLDPEIASASRTLRFAQQTADAVINEAREEAKSILMDADRQHEEIVAAAHRRADADYSAERDRVAAATAAWEERRLASLAQIDELSSVFGEYREKFGSLDSALTSVGEELRNGPPAASAVPAEAVVEEAPVQAAAPSEAELVPAEAIVESATADVIDITDAPSAPASAAAPVAPVEQSGSGATNF